MRAIIEEINTLIQDGKTLLAVERVQRALDIGIPAEEIMNDGLIKGLSIIGKKFRDNEVYVPEVLVSARAVSKSLEILRPHFEDRGKNEKIGTVILGTVSGDYHDIGKNIVRMMMESKGLRVVDIGVNVPAERFVSEARKYNADIIACSALLTTTMYEIGNVVKECVKAGIRDKVSIMIGGAPVSRELCRMVGADEYTVDAVTAADMALKICESNNPKKSELSSI